MHRLIIPTSIRDERRQASQGSPFGKDTVPDVRKTGHVHVLI